MKIGILETNFFSNDVIVNLENIGKVFQYDQASSLKDFMLDKEIIYTRLKYLFDKDLINMCKSLKYLICPTTGLNHIDVDFCNKKGINIISLKDNEELHLIKATPEHTFGLLLSLLRNYKYFFTKKTFDLVNDRLTYSASEINNRRVGIIGFGRVGKTISKYLNAFGAKISFYDKIIFKSEELKDYKFCKVFSKIEELIDKNEIIFLTASYTNGKTILNKELLNRMSDKYFINTSRGENIDENHLLHLIEENFFSGVAIDVIQDEQDKNSNFDKFLKLNNSKSNFIYTPHISGATITSLNKTEVIVTKILFKELNIRWTIN